MYPLIKIVYFDVTDFYGDDSVWNIFRTIILLFLFILKPEIIPIVQNLLMVFFFVG